jgi:hypothetical protein
LVYISLAHPQECCQWCQLGDISAAKPRSGCIKFFASGKNLLSNFGQIYPKMAEIFDVGLFILNSPDFWIDIWVIWPKNVAYELAILKMVFFYYTVYTVVYI